jgi:predicted helicase
LSGTKHNVFGIQTGVAISFMVKRAKAKGCRIFYARRPEMEAADEKLPFLGATEIESIQFSEVRPDTSHSWINLTDTDFETLLPLVTRTAKLASRQADQKAIFTMFSQGVKTNRDEWVWNFNRGEVLSRVGHLVSVYTDELRKLPPVVDIDEWSRHLSASTKWTRKLKKLLAERRAITLDADHAIEAMYRPFVRKTLYFAWELNEDWYQLDRIFRAGESAPAIVFTDTSPRAPFTVLACDTPFEHHLAASSDSFQGVGRFRFSDSGQRVDNISDWAIEKFRKHYQPGRGKKDRPISKEAIFHYVYGVLHDPIYREKYALNLKREFPRIPFYADFWQWADWGKALMDLHIGYETVAPYPLTRVDLPDEKARAAKQSPKAMLKADKQTGCIVLDSETTLRGVPPAAWEYRLGNRSALEWVLDQHKEKKPKDPTIREKFDTYRFADYKEKVIDLLSRVTTVSVRTVEIVEAMRLAKRS